MFRSMTGLVVCLLLSSAASGNLLVNGSFETPHVDFFSNIRPGDATLTGWTVENLPGTTYGVVLTEDYISDHYDGAQCVELNASQQDVSPWQPFAAGAISQTIATIPGREYLVEFAYSAQPNQPGTPNPKQAELHWDGRSVAELTVTLTDETTSNMKWRKHSQILEATGVTTKLRFVGTIPLDDDAGIMIDDISLQLLPPRTVIPEPAGGALLVMLAGAACSRRSRSSASHGRKEAKLARN